MSTRNSFTITATIFARVIAQSRSLLLPEGPEPAIANLTSLDLPTGGRASHVRKRYPQDQERPSKRLTRSDLRDAAVLRFRVFAAPRGLDSGSAAPEFGR